MRRAGPAVFVLLCAAWYCDKTIVNVIPSLPVPADFNAYYDGAKNVLHGHSPWAARSYIYPPLLAFALSPLAGFSYVTVRWIWFVISQLCLLGGAWLVWRKSGADWIAASAVALVWAVGGAAEEALGLGQPGPVLMFMAAIAMVAAGGRAASAIAAGFAIKLFPGVLGVWLAVRRQWRALAACAVLGAALIALPWAIVLCCLDGPKTPGSRDTWSGTPSALSWGLPSVTLRILDPPKQGGPLPKDWETDIPYLRLPDTHRWAAEAAGAIPLLAGLGVLAMLLRGASGSADPFAMAALVSLALAVSPVCWTHYQVVQYPGVAVLAAHAARSRRRMLLAGALLLGGLLYPIPVAVLTPYYMKYGKWTESLATLYLWTSIAPIASLGLFGLFVREARGTMTSTELS